MRKLLTRKRARREAGVALIIAIFALLLISVVAIALVVSAGTGSALQSNYRGSTGSYYSALAGLEEARGRLLWKNPDYINATNSYPALLNSQGLPTWGLTQVFYIDNPGAGENVDPTSTIPENYPDSEYQNEFGWALAGTVVTQIASKSPDTAASPSLPGDQYKWVRITPVTEVSLGLDVNGDGDLDPLTLVYYDPSHVDAFSNPSPGLIVPSNPLNPPATAVQALQITSLSVTPAGSRRILQYVVAPLVISPSTTGNAFPAALTLAGNGVTFQDAGGGPYKIDGRDTCSASTPPGSVASIGYINQPDYASINAEVQKNPSNYPGYPMVLTPPPPGTYVPTSPSQSNLSNPPSQIRQNWLSPVTLDAVVQDIIKSADVIINGNATGTDISNQASMMSATRPQTIVINGDLNLNGWHNSGYGLLLVTGTLNYDPDASWQGIVLVIGQGVFSSSKNGTGGIQGSVFVAKTRDGSGNLLTTPTLGAAFFGTLTSYGSNPGYGIRYSGCAGQSPTGPSAQGPLSYKVLSFREIPLTNLAEPGGHE